LAGGQREQHDSAADGSLRADRGVSDVTGHGPSGRRGQPGRALGIDSRWNACDDGRPPRGGAIVRSGRRGVFSPAGGANNTAPAPDGHVTNVLDRSTRAASLAMLGAWARTHSAW